MLANRCDDGSAVLFYNQSFVFGGVDGDLFRAAVWIPLAPDVTLTFHARNKVHPRTIGRPTRGGARALWPYWSWRRRALERDELAQRPLALSIHLDHESRPAIGGGERVMRHGPLVRRVIQFAKAVARYRLGNHSQVQTGTDSGEEIVLWVEPGQSRRILKQKMRVAA